MLILFIYLFIYLLKVVKRIEQKLFDLYPCNSQTEQAGLWVSLTFANTSAVLSRPVHYVRPQGPTSQKIIQIHNPAYILYLHNFLPLLGNIHLSLDYESPQNFLASPPEPKKYQSFFSHALSHYQTS